jgi:hypothetical protein
MQPMGRVLTVLGAAGVGIGLVSLLDTYWRWIGVALGYPPLVSGLVGGSLLLAGIGCLAAGRGAATPGARTPVRTPEGTKADHAEQG